jgi:YHS domain-containing protein
MGTVAYLLFWAVLIFVMMRFGCGAHVMGHHHHSRRNTPPGGNGEWIPPAQDRDPVCGKIVPTAGAKSSILKGPRLLFCSEEWRTKFEAAPRTYLGNVPVTHQPATHQGAA